MIERNERYLSFLEGKPGEVVDKDLFGREAYERDRRITLSPKLTLNQVIDKYKADPANQWNPKTKITYEHIFTLLLDYFGGDTPAREINRTHCRELRDLLINYPANATKIYTNLTTAERIERGKKEHAKCISVSTLNDYMSKLSSIFNWAINEELLEKNPARGLKLKDNVRVKDKRDPFSTEQLSKIFSLGPYQKVAKCSVQQLWTCLKKVDRTVLFRRLISHRPLG